MNKQYIQDPKDETKVIDTSVQPPSIDPKKISIELERLKQTHQELTDSFQENITELNKEIDFKQNLLDAIYTQVPEVEIAITKAEILLI